MRASFAETVMIIAVLAFITIGGFRIFQTMIGPGLSNQMNLSSVHTAQVWDSNHLDAPGQVLGGNR